MTAPKYYYNLNRCISDGKTQFDTTNMPKETYEVNGQIYYGSNDLMDLLNELHEENEQLKQAYTQLKHRHSLLHDECIDAECDRDSYHKDVVSLEKENEELKEELNNCEKFRYMVFKSLNHLYEDKE